MLYVLLNASQLPSTINDDRFSAKSLNDGVQAGIRVQKQRTQIGVQGTAALKSQFLTFKKSEETSMWGTLKSHVISNWVLICTLSSSCYPTFRMNAISLCILCHFVSYG